MKKIAFVALGDHALQSHLKPMLEIPNVQIVGAFDPNAQAFDRVRDEYGLELKHYAQYDDILADEHVDAVLIASPDKWHLPQLEMAVKAGKHAFCEKPLCNSEDEVPRLEAVFKSAQEQGLVVTSCHPRRFDKPYVWLKDNLADLTDRFGNPVELKLDFTYHKAAEDKAHLHGGSMLQDHFNHEIDYLHYVFGHVDFDAHKLLDQDDRYHASGIRDDGLAFSFGGTRRLDTRSYAESIHLRLERADVHIDTYNPDRSYIYDHHAYGTDKAFKKIEGIEPTDYEHRFFNINKNWVDTMNGITQNYLTDKDMLVNSRLSVAFAKQKSVRYTF